MFTRNPNYHDQPQEAPTASPDHSIRAQSGEDGAVVIGRGTRVEGKIGACSKLDVYGILEADVETGTLIIREGGGVRGTITTNRAEILGIVEGTLIVRQHLEVQPTGHVSGDVSYATLAIHTGGRLRGNISCEPTSEARAEEAEPTTPAADIIQFSGAQVTR